MARVVEARRVDGPGGRTTMSAHNRVMFVDDEEGVRVSWNRFLSERGFDVTTANDGRQAIDRLRDKGVCFA